MGQEPPSKSLKQSLILYLQQRKRTMDTLLVLGCLSAVYEVQDGLLREWSLPQLRGVSPHQLAKSRQPLTGTPRGPSPG